MDNETWIEFLWLDLPDFFDAKAICLVLSISPQVVLFHNLFCKAAVASFGEQCDFGMERHSALK